MGSIDDVWAESKRDRHLPSTRSRCSLAAVSAPYLPGRAVRTLEAQKRPWQVFWAVYTVICFILVLRLGAPLRWVAVAFAWVPVIHSWMVKRAIKQYQLDAAPAVEALRRDEPAIAEGHLRALREKTRWPRALHNTTSYNLGLALYRQGRLEEAIDVLADADRRGGTVTIDPSIASSLALFHALRGELQLAEPWLVEAQRRYAGRVTATRSPSLQPEVVVQLRRGELAAVKERLRRDWVEIENASKGESMKPIRVFRAFATAHAADGGEAEVAPLLAALHPARASDFDYLCTAWPELRSFLMANLPA